MRRIRFRFRIDICVTRGAHVSYKDKMKAEKKKVGKGRRSDTKNQRSAVLARVTCRERRVTAATRAVLLPHGYTHGVKPLRERRREPNPPAFHS